MNEDSKLVLIILFVCTLILSAIIGLLALASKIEKIYGPSAGLLTIILPIAVATVFMILILIKNGRKMSNSGTEEIEGGN